MYITQFFSLSLCTVKSSSGTRTIGCFAKVKNVKNTKILIDKIKRRKKLKVYERVWLGECFRLFFRAYFHTHKMPVVHKESDNRLDFSVVYKILLLRTALKISACNLEPQTSLWRNRYLFLKPVTLGFLHESREHVSGQKRVLLLKSYKRNHQDWT